MEYNEEALVEAPPFLYNISRNCRSAAWLLLLERSDAVVTYSELFQLGMLIIALIALCFRHRDR